jgi:hypothetical protein
LDICINKREQQRCKRILNLNQQRSFPEFKD